MAVHILCMYRETHSQRKSANERERALTHGRVQVHMKCCNKRFDLGSSIVRREWTAATVVAFGRARHKKTARVTRLTIVHTQSHGHIEIHTCQPPHIVWDSVSRYQAVCYVSNGKPSGSLTHWAPPCEIWAWIHVMNALVFSAHIRECARRRNADISSKTGWKWTRSKCSVYSVWLSIYIYLPLSTCASEKITVRCLCSLF